MDLAKSFGPGLFEATNKLIGKQPPQEQSQN